MVEQDAQLAAKCGQVGDLAIDRAQVLASQLVDGTARPRSVIGYVEQLTHLFEREAEVACATAALMTLFKTVGSFGKAESLIAHAEAVAATALVLILATAVMTGLLWLMGSLLQKVVS